jgi:hypothetical protein
MSAAKEGANMRSENVVHLQVGEGFAREGFTSRPPSPRLLGNLP